MFVKNNFISRRSFLDLARDRGNIRVRATDFGLALNGGNENGDQEESCQEEEEEHQEKEEALSFYLLRLYKALGSSARGFCVSEA